MYYINTLKRELVDTNAYKLQPSLSERVIVDGHGCHTALHFGVKAKENQDKVPTLYWLPKLHKKPYKARFIANSSSCTTTELSKLLTSCLTAVKKHVIKYCEKVYERSGKNLFWSIKNSGEILDKLKARDFNATSLSTYDFSTLYTGFIRVREMSGKFKFFQGQGIVREFYVVSGKNECFLKCQGNVREF